MVTALQAAASEVVFRETDRWERLGVATLPGPYGRKGPRIQNWPTLPHAEAWRLTRDAAERRQINLVARTGIAADGRRFIAAIDLDGKCSCEHDRDEHPRDGACLAANDGNACDCRKYDGTPPEAGLERLLALLPPGVAVSRTARGFHLIFWTAGPFPNGTLKKFSADFFGGLEAHALQVPPSLHPTGVTYQWLHEPDADLPTVDLELIGLVPDEQKEARPSPNRSARGGVRRTPALPVNQREFEAVMAEVGVRPQSGREEFHRCPWHVESEASLHVDWQAAIFCCFGCDEQGGLRRLRELAGGPLPPSYNPSSRPEAGVGRGLQLGGSGARDERDRLADALLALGYREKSERMRQCREASWDATDADLDAFACPNGDSTPVKSQTLSCDDAQCPCCMPWRLAADWRKRWSQRGADAPEHLTLVSLEALETSVGPDDSGYLKRVRARFREWHRTRALEGGFYGVTVGREGDAWRARLLLAVSDSDAERLTAGRAFAVQVLGSDLTSAAVIREWQRAYLAEVTAWDSLGELEAFRALIHGRRKFQGFGERVGGGSSPTTEEQTQEDAEMEAQPLHRMAGGSGKGAARPPCCPRCGERLKRLGRFDPMRMELITGDDGIWEWRWRAWSGAHPAGEGRQA